MHAIHKRCTRTCTQNALLRGAQISNCMMVGNPNAPHHAAGFTSHSEHAFWSQIGVVVKLFQEQLRIRCWLWLQFCQEPVKKRSWKLVLGSLFQFRIHRKIVGHQLVYHCALRRLGWILRLLVTTPTHALLLSWSPQHVSLFVHHRSVEYLLKNHWQFVEQINSELFRAFLAVKQMRPVALRRSRVGNWFSRNTSSISRSQKKLLRCSHQICPSIGVGGSARRSCVQPNLFKGRLINICAIVCSSCVRPLSHVRPRARPPVRPSVRPFLRPFVRPFLRPSARTSVRLSVRPFSCC